MILSENIHNKQIVFNINLVLLVASESKFEIVEILSFVVLKMTLENMCGLLVE